MLRASRRRVVQAAIAIASYASAIPHFLQSKEYRYDTILSDLWVFPQDPEEVARKFAEADTSFLLASYSHFFPKFIAVSAASDKPLRAIEKACHDLSQEPKYQDHIHRLGALPAVTAAHLLSETRDNRKRKILYDKIATTLRNPGREVREIVIQNLIGTMNPTTDSREQFFLDDQIISVIAEIIDECRETDKLLSPLALAIQCLLNARALKQHDQKIGAEINKVLERVKSESIRPIYFNYVDDLLQSHENCFKVPKVDNPFSLPPHRTELLMAWQYQYRRWPAEYMAREALIQARTMYSIWRTATGSDVEQSGSMTMEQAKVALPKSISFLRGMGWKPLLDGADARVPAEESGFRKFLQTDMEDLISHPHRHGIVLEPVSAKQKALARCVPFWQVDGPTLITKAYDRKMERSRTIVYFVLMTLAATALKKGAETVNFDDMIDALPTVVGTSQEGTDDGGLEALDDEEIKALQNQSRQAGEEADREIGPYLEEQEREMGPDKLPIVIEI